MLSPLTPAERTRLVGILGMLGSAHDGERSAAAALASRMVRDRGLTWDVLILGGGRQDGGASPDGPGTGWRTILAFCQRHQAALSHWEAHFTCDLRNRRTMPTPRQVAKLHQIADALRAVARQPGWPVRDTNGWPVGRVESRA
jgi:hypothetical protein